MKALPIEFAVKNPEFTIELFNKFPPKYIDEELKDWIMKNWFRKGES